MLYLEGARARSATFCFCKGEHVPRVPSPSSLTPLQWRRKLFQKVQMRNEYFLSAGPRSLSFDKSHTHLGICISLTYSLSPLAGFPHLPVRHRFIVWRYRRLNMCQSFRIFLRLLLREIVKNGPV